MRSQSVVLQFGKELLNIKGKTKQEQFRRDVRLSAHEKASELAVTFENSKSALYLNGTIHSQKSTALGSKILESSHSVFCGLSAHPDFFIFLRVSGSETLVPKRAAGTILAAVIVRGGNKAGFFP